MMEKNYLKNKLDRMEKLLVNQKSQQNKMADNYFNLLNILLKMQNKSPENKGIVINIRNSFRFIKK